MSKSQRKREKVTDELSRREWMVRLAEGAVLIGFSGAAPERSAAWESSLAGTEGSAATLPPGLYLPSVDHLTHALTNDERFRMVPPGSETDYVRPRNGPFEPQFFSRQEFRVIQRIVELMLGESAPTDRAQVINEVAEWIDLAVYSSGGVRAAVRDFSPQERTLAVHFEGGTQLQEVLSMDPQKICREGLEWLRSETARRYSTDFLALSAQQQADTLESISDARAEKSSENAGTRFFHLMKRETIRGFYTSAAGLKELDYKGNAFYPESPGCPKRSSASS
jgi:hypothetical protein